MIVVTQRALANGDIKIRVGGQKVILSTSGEASAFMLGVSMSAAELANSIELLRQRIPDPPAIRALLTRAPGQGEGK